jgi:hypothetical protein
VRELQRGFDRIIHGPTGGMLMSLAFAAFLGGVALAAPGPTIAPVNEAHGATGSADVVQTGDGSGHIADVAFAASPASRQLSVRSDGHRDDHPTATGTHGPSHRHQPADPGTNVTDHSRHGPSQPGQENPGGQTPPGSGDHPQVPAQPGSQRSATPDTSRAGDPHPARDGRQGGGEHAAHAGNRPAVR